MKNSSLTVKNFAKADEVRNLPKTTIEVVSFADTSIILNSAVESTTSR